MHTRTNCRRNCRDRADSSCRPRQTAGETAEGLSGFREYAILWACSGRTPGRGHEEYEYRQVPGFGPREAPGREAQENRETGEMPVRTRHCMRMIEATMPLSDREGGGGRDPRARRPACRETRAKSFRRCGLQVCAGPVGKGNRLRPRVTGGCKY